MIGFCYQTLFTSTGFDSLTASHPNWKYDDKNRDEDDTAVEYEDDGQETEELGALKDWQNVFYKLFKSLQLSVMSLEMFPIILKRGSQYTYSTRQ